MAKRPEINVKGEAIKEKRMYTVEKFLPSECPKCRHKFERQNDDWILLLGDILNSTKVVRKTKGYDIIICQHCQNITARFPLELYRLSDRKKAESLLKVGFVNLQAIDASRGVSEDCHEVLARIPNISVEGV